MWVGGIVLVEWSNFMSAKYKQQMGKDDIHQIEPSGKWPSNWKPHCSNMAMLVSEVLPQDLRHPEGTNLMPIQKGI